MERFSRLAFEQLLPGASKEQLPGVTEPPTPQARHGSDPGTKPAPARRLGKATVAFPTGRRSPGHAL